MREGNGQLQKGFKDLGDYSAKEYEGLITQPRVDVKIGLRYFFQPRMCMLHWRHSGLVNFVNRTPDGFAGAPGRAVDGK